jgi:HEAT repeat protein
VKLFNLLLVSAFLAYPQSLPDTRQRIRTVKDLAKQGQDGIAGIAPYIKDFDLDVRLEAVKALDDIGGPKTIDALVQATHDNDPEMQIRATDGLVNVYLPGYLKTGITGSLKRAGTTVRAKFSDSNDQVVDAFVEARTDVVQALGRLAKGGASMESRANAARAVGVLRGRAAIPDLVDALYSKDDQVMYESLVALQKIRDPSAGPKASFLVEDLVEKVQIAALQTVGILRTREAAPDVRDALKRARNSKIKKEALTALAMIADPSDHPLFIQYMADRDDDLRTAAAEGLARIKNPVDRAFLADTFSKEHSNNARLADAFAVSSLGNYDVSEFGAFRYLINTLNSKVYRDVAMAYLTEVTRDLAARQAIYPLIKDATRDEKIGLSIVLSRSGGQDSEPYLEALQKDSDPQVMQEGVRSLRTLRSRLP